MTRVQKAKSFLEVPSIIYLLLIKWLKGARVILLVQVASYFSESP